MNDVTFTDWGYCFAHQGQTEFTVTHHTDGQETVTCHICGAQGFGPAVNPKAS